MSVDKVKPFYNQNGFTEFNNYVLDYIMPNLSPNAWKVLCFILRKTKGWQKGQDQLSFSQIMDGTGIKNRTTINNATTELENNDYILIVHSTDRITPNTYSLNINLEITLPSTEIVPASTEIVLAKEPEVVQKSYPQKKVVNNDIIEDSTEIVLPNWEKVYNRWVSQFGDMKSGQVQLFGDYFDDNPEWTFRAVNETIARGELSDPFPYFKRIIDSWFKLGYIPERELPIIPKNCNGANYNGNQKPTAIKLTPEEKQRADELNRQLEAVATKGI